MKVPLHFVNADIAPGVKLQGGVVSHVLNELDVKCLPADLPEFIEVDLKDVAVGHSMHVKDLKLPKGVETVLHRRREPGGGHHHRAARHHRSRAGAGEEAEPAPAVAAAACRSGQAREEVSERGGKSRRNRPASHGRAAPHRRPRQSGPNTLKPA
jgi:large subunit ribosomal protein L25